MRKYVFDWNLLGDLSVGRPNLGPEVGVDVYRLMQFTLRDVLEEEFSAQKADEIYFKAGKLAGTQFYEKLIHPVSDMGEFVNKLQKVLLDKKIGVLRIEDVEEGEVYLTVDEDLECSGLPITNFDICVYDEGFVSGLFECFTGKQWRAKEIDCWCTGDRTCRFLVSKEGE